MQWGATLVMALACWLAGTASALAQVDIIIDPFHVAEARGVRIFDLREVTVAILGSNDVNPAQIDARTLRLGTRDEIGAPPLDRARRLRDVNGDGIKDRLVVFNVKRTGLRAGVHVQAVLQGDFRDGTEFHAYGSVISATGATVDNCVQVENVGATVAMRCIFTTSVAPLALTDLVTSINSILTQENSGYLLSSTSPLAIEAWGGNGHDGENDYCEYSGATAKGGNGGSGGYARTVMTVGDVESELGDGTNIYLYVGSGGPSYQDGGSSSLVIGKNVTSVTSSETVYSARVFADAGGGGGGGRGNCKGDFTAEGGYHGGNGGTAKSSTSGHSSVAGDDGGNSHKGKGGNSDGNGAGGAATGDGAAGNSGVGGFGNNAKALWKGSELNGSNWPDGEGGEGGNGNAGGGGGGFGGGGGGEADTHKGGGGGGGSWARGATVSVDSLDDAVLLGPSGESSPVIVLTFQIVPLGS